MLLGLKCAKWMDSRTNRIFVSCALICLSHISGRRNIQLIANCTVPSLNGILIIQYHHLATSVKLCGDPLFLSTRAIVVMQIRVPTNDTFIFD